MVPAVLETMRNSIEIQAGTRTYKFRIQLSQRLPHVNPFLLLSQAFSTSALLRGHHQVSIHDTDSCVHDQREVTVHGAAQ